MRTEPRRGKRTRPRTLDNTGPAAETRGTADPRSATTSRMFPRLLPYPEIDPALFSVSLGGFELALRWYALAYIGGLLLGWWLVVQLVKRPRLWPDDTPPMTPKQPEDLLTWMTLGVILGGRLCFVLFYNPGHYWENPADILKIWEGGMSFHGGFIGSALAIVLWTRAMRLPLLQVADAVAVVTPVGLFFGRIANFINGELWGRPSDVPWAMVFPGAGPEPRHPSQLYEAALEGLLLGAVMGGLAVSRGWLKHPGRMVGVFFIGYGLARSFVENFRQWDAQLGYVVEMGSGGLTMGQVLSLPMILVGLGFVVLARRRTAG